jgi:hypothetical protein
MNRPRLLFWAALLLLGGTVLRPLPETGVAGPCFPEKVVLGVNDQGEESAALLETVGLRWVRITIPWREVNPSKGAWDWEASDGLVDAHQRAGHAILAVLSTAPEWAGSNANGTKPPGDVALWQELVGRVAARYRGRIAAYEIWNEPDRGDEGVGVGWAGSLWSFPAYADYLRAAAVEIRANAPGTLVVAPALGSDPREATVELLRSLEEYPLPEGNASELVDVVSFHANARGDEGSAVVWQRFLQHLRTLARRNPSSLDKPIWITELGWASDAAGEAGQREKIENLLARLAGEWPQIGHPRYCGARHGTVQVFLYKEIDTPGESRGLFRADGTPKPVVTEYLRAAQSSRKGFSTRTPP